MAGNFVEVNGRAGVAGLPAEAERPAGGAFNAFLKPPSSVVATGAAVCLPAPDDVIEPGLEKFHAEPECAIRLSPTSSSAFSWQWL